MLVRCKHVALLALVPSLAFAAPKARPKKPPVKKPPTSEPAAPAPAATPDAADKDKAPEPTPASGEAASRGVGTPTAQPAGRGSAPAGSIAPSSPANSGSASGGSSDGAASAAKATEDPGKPAGDSQDVDSLRQEYLSLRDELFKSRARANAVASQLYSTRVQIKLTYTTGRYYNPGKSVIRLDGANVYEDATGAIAGDDGVRFDGYIAPGRHLITFHVEATGKDDDSFTSTTESQIVVKAVAGKDLLVAARAKDSGDIAYEWKRSEHGSYGLGVDISVKTAKTEAAPAAAPAAKGAKK